MFDEFWEFLNEKFGWIIGTKLHGIKIYEASKPLKRADETVAEFARRLGEFKRKFFKPYTHKAKIRRILIGIAFLLLITNPSLKNFKEYTGDETYHRTSRRCNLFICSIYQDKGKFYLGILGNFILVLYY